MQGDNTDDGDSNPLQTRTDIDPLKEADACFIALKHLDLSSEEDQKEVQDRVTRAMRLYNQANRPDMVLEVMKYAKILDPVRDRRLYINAIAYHQEQHFAKKQGKYIEELDDNRHHETHRVMAIALAKNINLESIVLGFEDTSV